MRVLVVEDEPKVAEALREGLEAEQYEVIARD
jgi:DNA-binding response OmpR family regulator